MIRAPYSYLDKSTRKYNVCLWFYYEENSGIILTQTLNYFNGKTMVLGSKYSVLSSLTSKVSFFCLSNILREVW